MKNQMLSLIRALANPRGWAYGLFWAWNIIFVAFMLLGFAPNVLPTLLTAVNSGTIPSMFLFFGVTLAAIPVIAIVIGLTVLRRSPIQLAILGYGIEGPLMFMLAFRFFLIREATFAVNVLMAIAILGMATLLWQLVDRNIDERGILLTYLRGIGLTLYLLIILYGSLWIAIYAVPFAVQFLNGLGGFFGSIWQSIIAFDWQSLARVQWGMVPFGVLGTLLVGFSSTLFIAAPIAVPLIAIFVWRRAMRACVARVGVRQAIALASIVLILCAGLFVVINQQPQRAAFALLKNPPTNLTEAHALQAQEATIRDGLLNAYLAPFRYISSMGDVQFIRNMYQMALKLNEDQVNSVAQVHDSVARPLLYEPVNSPLPGHPDGQAMRAEPSQAANLYKAYFDQSIIQGEHATVVNTVRSTWQFSQAEAAWQAVDDRRVHLARQEINVKENGDWAEVELHEVYENQTSQLQEVVYYFSLPESAVVTGLWLGNSDDRGARFAYRVSPRGAAQAVYRNEVRRWQDPALVEQIGPRQYRLRIFPIERRQLKQDATTKQWTGAVSPPMHVWLTYRVLASDNAWALPHLAEKINVYWDAATVRLLNGKAMTSNVSDWLPAPIAATTSIKPVAHRVEFPSGETMIVRPLSANDLSKLSGKLRLAIVLDRSRSMSRFKAEAKSTLARLSQVAGATTDVFLTAAPYRGEAPSRISLAQLNLDNIEYLSGQNAGELLAQYDTLRAGQTYDAIFVITDGSGYELGPSSVPVPKPTAPVWMIHLGGNLPLGYDDATLEAIQSSGGGVTGSVDEALNRLAVTLNVNSIASLDAPASGAPDWVDGYAWSIYSTQLAGSKPSGALASDAIVDDFGAFAARRLILTETQRQRSTLGQLTTLDQLHAVAVKYGVVTPYSSMIVLVNSQQQQLLNQLEAQSDRFQREFEDVGNTANASPFSVTGVPEPEEWLLIASAIVLLFVYGYRSRFAPQRTHLN